MSSQQAIVTTLLERHGRTFAAELGVDPARNTPSPLFRLLCFALLASTRVGADIAMRAARSLAEQGWTTADKLGQSSWRERTDVLNRAGYARYDESTARMLGDTTALLIEHYGGDLRRLRERAERDPARERKLLKECKGIGDVGANIFLREAQAAWGECYPFADKLALRAAGRLDLGDDAESLAEHAPQAEFPRLVAALVRCEFAGDHDNIKATASS